jgi:HPt (histidine-containing phosphotransfer) domain-containing protein
MTLHIQGIEWMPSPPLAPDDGPIDLGQLRRATFGDATLEREVLAMFVGQATRLVGMLGAIPSDAAALAHTLKGSARAIGAFRVADAAGELELTIRNGGDPAAHLAELKDTVAEASCAIEAILRPS